MRRFATLVAVGALAAAFLVPQAGHAAPHVVGAMAVQFTPPTVTINQGDTLTFVNTDTFSPFAGPHNLVHSSAFPLFSSGPPQGVGSVQPVAGVSVLPTGSYPFYCTFHGSFMSGTLVVQ